MDAKEFLATKRIFGLDTKKRFKEVLDWMEEYASTQPAPVPAAVVISHIEKFLNPNFWMPPCF